MNNNLKIDIDNIFPWKKSYDYIPRRVNLDLVILL